MSLKEDKQIVDHDYKLYLEAKKIVDAGDLTFDDYVKLNNIATILIDNEDYAALTMFNRLEYNDANLRNKIDFKIAELKITIETFFDYVNFGERGEIDKLKEYYKSNNMDENLKNLLEMLGEDNLQR